MPNLQRLYKPQEERRKEAGKMTLEDFKQIVSDRTGIPANLLNGETAEETIAHAKALMAYKKNAEATRQKTPREQFAEWLQAQEGGQPEEVDPIAQIEEDLRIASGGYPIVRDGGSANVNLGDGRSPQEQFSEWIGKQFAFDQFKSSDGWRPLI